MICYHYGYPFEYSVSLSQETRQLLVKQIIAEKSEERLFRLRSVSLSHTPGTESGARQLDNAFREEYSRNIKLLNFGRDYYMEAIEEAEGLTDDNEGQLTYIPD